LSFLEKYYFSQIYGLLMVISFYLNIFEEFSKFQLVRKLVFYKEQLLQTV